MHTLGSLSTIRITACSKTNQESLRRVEQKQRQLPTYEQWIEAIHPENTHDGQLIAGLGKEIDERFYIEESDHRRLWNEHVGPSQQVPARGRVKIIKSPTQSSQSTSSEPLLLDLFSTSTPSNNVITTESGTNGNSNVDIFAPSNGVDAANQNDHTKSDLIQF